MAMKNIKTIYDTCRQLTTFAETQVADGKPIDAGILKSLENAFLDIVEYEKMYLIQCQDKFYGSMLMNMDFAIDFSQRGAVDLRVNCDPITISVNPLFCSQYKFAEFTGLIVSEIIRMVWLHPASFAQSNPEKDEKKHQMLEKASDASAFSIVKNDIRLEMSSGNSTNGCRLPNGSYTPTGIKADCGITVAEKMPLKYYYDILNKFYKEVPPMQQGAGSGTSNHNNTATQNNDDGHPVHCWENDDSEETKERITALTSEVYNNLDERSRGMMAGSVESMIKALLEPPQIPWQSTLRKMIGSVPAKYRKTRTRLNRRQPFRADLSGRVPNRTVNIICAFDTSGSMSDNDLKYCINEVFNLVKAYEGVYITIIECDAEIQKVYTAKKMSDVQTKLAGRGGTSFVPVINYINGTGEYKNSKKYPHAGKYRDALMVYFTDGYGDYEIPKPRTYRNLWVIMNDKNALSLKEPYGEVVSISTDKNFKHS